MESTGVDWDDTKVYTEPLHVAGQMYKKLLKQKIEEHKTDDRVFGYNWLESLVNMHSK